MPNPEIKCSKNEQPITRTNGAGKSAPTRHTWQTNNQSNKSMFVNNTKQSNVQNKVLVVEKCTAHPGSQMLAWKYISWRVWERIFQRDVYPAVVLDVTHYFPEDHFQNDTKAFWKNKICTSSRKWAGQGSRQSFWNIYTDYQDARLLMTMTTPWLPTRLVVPVCGTATQKLTWVLKISCQQADWPCSRPDSNRFKLVSSAIYFQYKNNNKHKNCRNRHVW